MDGCLVVSVDAMDRLPSCCMAKQGGHNGDDLHMVIPHRVASEKTDSPVISCWLRRHCYCCENAQKNSGPLSSHPCRQMWGLHVDCDAIDVKGQKICFNCCKADWRWKATKIIFLLQQTFVFFQQIYFAVQKINRGSDTKLNSILHLNFHEHCAEFGRAKLFNVLQAFRFIKVLPLNSTESYILWEEKIKHSARTRENTWISFFT